MYKKSIHQNVITLLVLFIAVTSIMLAFGSDVFSSQSAVSLGGFDEGYSISARNEVLESVSLSSFHIKNIKRGEIIRLYNELPEEKIVSPTLMFITYLSIVDVYVDGRLVYSYGHEYYNEEKIIPKKQHLITLDDRDKNNKLEIVVVAGENGAFESLGPIYFGTRKDLIKSFLQKHRLVIFIGGFFIMYACLLLSLALYLSLQKKRALSLLTSAGVAILFGAYIYAYEDVFCFISNNAYFFTMLEYITLYFIPLAIVLTIYSVQNYKAGLFQRILEIINFILPVIFIILHVLNKVHLSRFPIAIHILCVADILFIFPPLVKRLYSEFKKELESTTYTGINAFSYLTFGFIIFMFMGFIEIVKYNVQIYGSNPDNFLTRVNYLTLGALYFAICLFIYYLLNGIEHVNSKYVKEQLEGLAYTDELTGLMNRAKCMQFIKTLSGPYAVVSIDLDRLKTVNDSYGHLEGDKMIKSFAELLVKAFQGASLIGRTGGDEFMVIYENPSSNVCDMAIRQLEDDMNEFNQKGEIFNLSASMGYAYSSERSSMGFTDVFYLADSRMYEMKEKHHA